jgi:hypothetical protein
LGATTKDKFLFAFDPRSESPAAKIVSSHQGPKAQRMTFLGNQESILTVGFSTTSEREFAIWDLRNSASPIAKRKLDDL